MRYLDFNATAPLTEACAQLVRDWSGKRMHGNPNSAYRLGRQAREAIEEATSQVAQSVGVKPSQVTFVPGASFGLLQALRESLTPHWISGKCAEVWALKGLHEAAHEPLEKWEKEGRIRIRWIELHSNGSWDLEPLGIPGIQPPDVMVLAHGHHETGVIYPIASVRDRWPHVPLVVDAVQTYGKVPVDLNHLGAQWMVLSGHKVGALPGIGALIRGQSRDGLLLSGEAYMPRGTENTLAIAAFGLAATEIQRRVACYATRAAVKEQFEEALKAIGDIRIMGEGVERLPNTTYCVIPGMDGEEIQDALDRLGYCVGTGAACNQVNRRPSRALVAMGVSSEDIFSAIRVSTGPEEDPETLENLATCLEEWLPRLKQGEFPRRAESC